ncbi:MAG: pilus assembly protein PilM [Syntrophales bacterium]
MCLKSSFRGRCLAAHAVYPLERGGAEAKATEIRTHVNEFLREHRISAADIFLGVPRDLTILRFIDLPSAVKENLRGTLLYEMEKYVPLPAGELYFDYQIISEDKETNKLQVLLVAVKKEFIDPYLDHEHPSAAGISGIEINSIALANYLSSQPITPNGDTYAIVHLGRERLELSLVRKKLLHYSRQVNVAQQRNSLRHIVTEELELLRKTVGPEQGRLEVVICGPDAGSLGEILKDREDISLRPLEIPGADLRSDALATAYGLALKGLQKMPMDINLLPVGLRKKVSNVGFYTMFVLAGLFILSLLAWGGSTVLHQKRVSEKLDSEVKQLSAEVANISRTQEKMKELESRIDAINTLRQRHVPALSILRDLSKDIPAGAWFDRLTFTDKGGEIEGYADSASALIPLLAASPLLKDVAFLSPITKSTDGKERFRIGFKMR